MYPRVFDYSGPFYLAVALERLASLQGMFDLVDLPRTVQVPVQPPAAELPERIVEEDEEFALEREPNVRVATVAKGLLEQLAYEGGDAYLDTWVAGGGRNPG